ncbi:MAG TPA: peptidase M12 [Flavisolibacter sp.]|jgi:hypothetical protein|nr:peptidase M12 [Flavisolibacter sp.]
MSEIRRSPETQESATPSLRSSPATVLNQEQWCFAWPAAAPPTPPGTAEKAVLIKEVKWPQGSKITISFLGGDPTIQERVREAAMGWVSSGLANLTFEFLDDTNKTDIRISFEPGGSWSVLGTTCRRITNTKKATMNFGWLNHQTSEEELRRVVLHEFGHALGLTHEHMHPEGGIPWNTEAVYQELMGPPNNWSKDTVDNNMFRTFEVGETNFTALDKDSIMMYPIPAKWTTNGFSVGLNSELSETDKRFIRNEYP